MKVSQQKKMKTKVLQPSALKDKGMKPSMHAFIASCPVLVFSKLNKLLFGYFDPKIIFIDNENT